MFKHPFIQALGYGVYTIDTGFIRPGLVASHLLVEQDQAVFIDVGTATALPVLLEALDYLKIRREQLVAVIVTHVHLDHAGCAGALMEQLPNAKLMVRPRGARHMVDPSQLVAGATAVYGESLMRERFGHIKAVEHNRVVEVDEVFRFRLGTADNIRELRFIYTPGHAKHHFCVYDSLSKGVFTGDSFGLSYRDFDTVKGPFILPTTSPVQFEPQASHDSIEKILRLKPSCLYLTHFGKLENPDVLAEALHRQIDFFVEQVKAVSRFQKEAQLNALTEQLNKLLTAQVYEHGCQISTSEFSRLMDMDINLNAQGLLYWLHKREAVQ